MGGFDVSKVDNTQNALYQKPKLDFDFSSSINISFKFKPIAKPLNASEQEIKLWVEKNFPEIKWDTLSQSEKRNYIIDYASGAMAKRLEEKKSEHKLSGRETNNLIKTKLKLEANKQLTKQAVEFAISNGMLEDSTDAIIEFINNDKAIGETQYQYAKSIIDKNPTILEEGNKKGHRTLITAYKRGKLEHEVAEANGMTITELQNSEEGMLLKYLYLRKKSNEGTLDDYEAGQYSAMDVLYKTFNGDLTGIQDHKHGDIEKSCISEVFNDEKDLDLNHLTEEQRNKLIQHITLELKECKTPEEAREQIVHILSNTANIQEQYVLAGIFDTLREEGIVDPEDYKKAIIEGGLDPHVFLAQSANGSIESQKLHSEIAAQCCTGPENARLTAKQAGAFVLNVTTKYHEEAQAHAGRTMADTGIQEVLDVMPEALTKYEEGASKEVYSHLMTSENFSAEQKATIARDTIDLASENEELRKFYEEIATTNNIDYQSVPPRSERSSETKTDTSTSNAENSKSSNNVPGTSYTQQEISEILNSTPRSPNLVSMALNGIKEITETILTGRTPDIQNANVKKIDSINNAIKELKSGTKLSDVFGNSSMTVKKELIGVICQYGKTAIGQLINNFGGDTIYNMATDPNDKAFIKEEIKRIALSDSTQRTALKEIEKQEAKQGKAKA